MTHKCVLVVNDDGIHAPGLLALVKELDASCACKVFVCAPDRERSAQSHARTITEPIIVRAASVPGAVCSVQISGTPADCSSFAIHGWASAFPEWKDCKPDLVVSGINRGRNVGLDCVYSGTVAGAREAAMVGVPAIAVSLCNFRAKTMEDYSDAACMVTPLVKAILRTDHPHRLPRGCVLNVNVPCTGTKLKGYFITHQGSSFIIPKLVEVETPQAAGRSVVLPLVPTGTREALLLATTALQLPAAAYLWCKLATPLKSSLKLEKLESVAMWASMGATIATAVGLRLALHRQAAAAAAGNGRSFLFKIKAMTEDPNPGADSREAENHAWVSVTPLGHLSHDGTVLMTSDLPMRSKGLSCSPGLQAAALILFAGKEAGLAVESVGLGLQNKL